MLSEAAQTHGITLVGGSVPERSSSGRLFNTCCVYDPSGRLVAKHRCVG
jgi:omega-amidase